jgi:polyhydroxyalkanoate synthesis regulator phasin
MKVLLDIKESKAAFIMELLHSFSYVKAMPLSPYKAQVLEELQEAVENMKLVKEGKLTPRPARELLDEL